MARSRGSATGGSRSAKTGQSLQTSSKSGRSGRTTKAIAVKAGALLSYSAVKGGLPAAQVKDYLEKGRLRRSDVAMVIPRRTFERRLSENQTLKVDEADAIARLLRVRDHARRVFDDDDLAEEWLTLPNPELGGEIPIEMARTDVGGREVEAVLGRIEHGVHA